MSSIHGFRRLFWLVLLLTGLIGGGTRALSQPANDNFANAITISGQFGSTMGTNVGATSETGEVTAGNLGATVWYRWTPTVNSGAAFTLASSARLQCVFYTGTAVNNLVQIQHYTSGLNTATFNYNFNAVAGTTYWIQVQDYVAGTGGFTLSWQPGPDNDNFVNAVSINGPNGVFASTNVNATPQAGEATAGNLGATVWYRWAPAIGGNAVFTVSSSARLQCVVYTGSALGNLVQVNHTSSGLNTATFSYNFAAVANTTYWIQVQDYVAGTGGFILSGGLPTANDLFANASVLSGNAGRVVTTNLFATSESGEPNHAGVTGGASIWFKWTAPVSGNIVFTTGGSDFDTLLGVYTGSSVNALTLKASNDNNAQGVNGSSRVMFQAAGGTTYYIAVDGSGGATGNVVLRWLPPVNNFDVESGGKTDVLFQNQQSGQLVYWTLNGTSFAGYNSLNPSNPGPGWNVVGTTDLNNDGKPDVVFQNQTTGKLAYWTLIGPQAYNIALLGDPGSPDWKVVSLTDLDGDGKSDILFQNQQTGNLVYWLMDGVVQRGSGALNPLNPGTGWKVVGAADFNGDDKPDLLFQNTQTGTLVYWLMDGVNLITYGFLSPSIPGDGWNVVSLADFNGDGQADVLFQNQQSGKLAYWFMNGISEVTIGLLEDPGTPIWKVVSSH